jgi:hypothetical protein
MDLARIRTGKVLNRISDERERQDAKWGGAEHDDQHGDGLWLAVTVKKLGDHVKAEMNGDPLQSDEELVQAAATLVAWLEGRMRKRLNARKED